ncbi:adenylosuccinate lyase [Campylobacter hyointestinalis]|uniref:adenylosuccinate lyase n=1 Tax=Campylobacter hyointestinalis TaxID=198 RepID=UPI0007241281|nr:adenylosuccinate lyase [Campylobacter hyointestinalis]CUU71707.1 adenylosuccinate lyase [Campylobacter hyointestinalis subsp. hyointestinalis]
MNITQTLESITITTDDDSLFLSLADKIKENFTNSIKSRDKVILFYNENELVQRKYFLKLIGKIYEKTSNDKIDFLFTHHKNIKLVYKKANSVQILININIKFDKNHIIFDLSKSDDIFNKYLIKCVGTMKYEFFKNENLLSVSVDKAEKLDIFDSLFSFKEHIKYAVNFNFDEGEYESFKKRIKIQNSKNYVRRFSMLASLLEEHFETLGCNANDDFETVRAKYLNLTKMYHPDRHLQKTIEIQKNYTDKFQKIGLAYEALKPYFREQDNFISA